MGVHSLWWRVSVVVESHEVSVRCAEVHACKVVAVQGHVEGQHGSAEALRRAALRRAHVAQRVRQRVHAAHHQRQLRLLRVLARQRLGTCRNRESFNAWRPTTWLRCEVANNQFLTGAWLKSGRRRVLERAVELLFPKFLATNAITKDTTLVIKN